MFGLGYSVFSPGILVLYIPVILSAVIIFRDFNRDNKIWGAIIGASLLTGVAPLVALVYLFFARKRLNAEAKAARLPANQLATTDHAPAVQSQPLAPADAALLKRRVVGAVVLSSLATIVLVLSGLAAAGVVLILVLFTFAISAGVSSGISGGFGSSK